MGIIVQRLQTVVLLLAATTVANLRAQYDMITKYELSRQVHTVKTHRVVLILCKTAVALLHGISIVERLPMSDVSPA